jgi:hypothetical protein
MAEERGLRDIREGRTGDPVTATLGIIAGGLAARAAARAAYRNSSKVRTVTHFVGKKMGVMKDLPKNWVEQKDEAGNKIWYNEVTHKSSYTIPRPEPTDPDALPEPWEERESEKGKAFYYNTKTGKSTFERPQKAAPVQRNWVGMKKSEPPAVVRYGVNGNPAPVHAPPDHAPPGPVPSKSRAERRAAGKEQKKTMIEQHELQVQGLKMKLEKLKQKSTKGAETSKGKLKGVPERAMMRKKIDALGKASSKLKELIIHKEQIGALNGTHKIHKFTTLMGEVTKKDKFIASQPRDKYSVEDVKTLNSLLNQTRVAFDEYAALDVAKPYPLDEIRSLLGECLAAVAAVEASV